MKYDLTLFKKLTILFVEDEVIIRTQMTDTLKIFFNQVLVASNGHEALQLLANNTVDLILSDVKMPIMNGLDLASNVRLKNHSIPIILLSSYSDHEILLKAINSDIDGYILKPIVIDDLLTSLNNVLIRKITTSGTYAFSDELIYNVFTEELHKKGELIDLGKKEKKLLKLFMNNDKKTLTKDEIIFDIWEYNEVTESALKNLLNRLRSKIGFDIIVSVKGSGWKLNNSK